MNHFLKFGDGYNIVDRPEDSICREQQRKWRAKADLAEMVTRAEMTPITVHSKSRPGVSYSSLAFFQSR